MAGGATEEQAASRVVWQGRWELPRELEARHIAGRLGVARCRAARACRGLRAAVAVARDLGAFRHRVLALAAGHEHSVVCTGDAVCSFGQGGRGQLGYETEYQATPRMVAGLLAEDVVAAAASRYSTLVRTAEGRAYWFGRLHDNQSGLAIVQSSVPGLLELYSWGAGYDGRLGHTSTQPEWSPRRVEGLTGKVVVKAAAGSDHSVVVTQKQEVYTFGLGRRGQLGHGSTQSEITPRRLAGLETR